MSLLLFLGAVLAGYNDRWRPVIRGRVASDGQPLADADCYAMPDCYGYVKTDLDGRFELRFAPLDHASEIDVCVVAPDGRRTEFGEHVVRLGLVGTTLVTVDLTARRPWFRPR